jgi:hypothetical protein
MPCFAHVCGRLLSPDLRWVAFAATWRSPPCHPGCCIQRITAPAKLATVPSNSTIVHQSVLRVFGWRKKSCIGHRATERGVIFPLRRRKVCGWVATIKRPATVRVPPPYSVSGIESGRLRDAACSEEQAGWVQCYSAGSNRHRRWRRSVRR